MAIAAVFVVLRSAGVVGAQGCGRAMLLSEIRAGARGPAASGAPPADDGATLATARALVATTLRADTDGA